MKFIKFSIYFILSFTILFGADYANEAKEIENKFKEVITLYKDGKNATKNAQKEALSIGQRLFWQRMAYRLYRAENFSSR